MKKTSIFGKLAMGLFAGLCFLTGSNAQNTYVKVTSTEDLEAGGKYLIVCESHSMAMGGQTNTNYRGHVTVSISSNTISTAVAASESDDAPFEITLGGTDGAWTLQDEASDNYLRLNANGNNLHSGDSYEWTISFDQEGNAQINASTFPERFIRYNASSPRFACYRSSSTNMSEVQLYKKQEAAPEAPTVSLQPSSLDLSTTPNEATTGTITITGANLTQDITVALSGDNAGYFSADAETLTATDIMAEGGKTLTITYTPTEAGVHTATLTLSSDDLTNPVTATLNGVAIKEVANLAALYEDYANVNEDQTYTLSGNVVVTHKDNHNTRIWAQDADMTDGASILIYRAEDYGFADIEAGDVIEGLTGTMSVYNNLLEFLPTETLNVSESGRALHVDTLSFTEIEENLLDHQSALVCVENVSFEETGTFASGTNYILHQDGNDMTFRTDYYNADYIDQAIPDGELTIIGILTQYSDNAQLTARSMADFNTPGAIIIPAPTFSPDPSVTYTDSVEVSIACATEEADIFYAIGENEFTAYTEPFVLKASDSVRAFATVGEDSSLMAKALYSILPTLTPEGDIVLQENFDGFSAGNLQAQNSEVSEELDNYTSVPGWSGERIYQAGGLAKLGTGSGAGRIQLPSLDLSHDNGRFYVSFTAMAWSNDAQEINLTANENTVSVPNLINAQDRSLENMREYVFLFENGTESTTISFAAQQASNNRFFLDSIRIYQVVPEEPSLIVNETIEMEATVGQSSSTTVNVRGLHLTEDVNIACPEGNFSVEPATLDADSVMRVNGADFNISYNGALSVDSVNLTLTSGELSETIKVYARAVEMTEAANLAELYDHYENLDEEETFRVTGDIVVTHTDSYNTRIWAQDADMTDGASILIFRAGDYGFENIKVGDVIENLTGTMSVYNNLLEFLPTEALSVSESGRALHADTLTVAEIEADLLDYQSALVCIKGVEFLTDGTFATGTNYDLLQGQDTLVFRTDYFGADYIGQNIPSEELTITGILTQFHDDAQITARSLADFALPADYLAAPVFSPAAGTYTDSMEVSISCATEDAEIFYAIDDAEFTAYENAFWIKNSCNIHAFATLNGENSDTTTVAYTIRDTWTPAGDTLLYEPFDAFTTGDWNNDNVAEGSSDIAEDLDDYTLMPGWTGAKVYSVAGTAKMGTSSALGYIALPALTLDQDKEMFAVSFRAMAWNGDATMLRLVVNGDTILVEGLDNNGNNPDNFKSYSFLFENDTEEADICFIGAKTSKGRFFLDDVRVCYMAAEPTLMVDETIEMEAIAGQSTSTTVNVRGLYLAEDVTIICPQGHFSIDPTLLNADSVMRSNGANFTVAYDGTDILDSVSLTLTSGELSQTVMVYARAVEMTQVANLAGLYDYYENLDEEETFRVTGEIVVTHTDAFNTRIWAQDADMTDGASILIFRAGDYGFADIETGDVIEGLTGTMSVYNNLLEFLPTEELNVTESGHALHVDTLSFTEIKANLLDYQSALVCVENVSFTTPDSAFATGTNYDLLQDQDSLVFRTDFYNADYIGEDIPTGQLNITGILTQYYDDAQLTARNMDDIQIIRVANEAYANSMEARIYPNPTSGMFYIDIEGDAQVDIFAANGTLVESLDLTAGLHEMNLAHKGIYFVRISNGKALTVKRVIVL